MVNDMPTLISSFVSVSDGGGGGKSDNLCEEFERQNQERRSCPLKGNPSDVVRTEEIALSLVQSGWPSFRNSCCQDTQNERSSLRCISRYCNCKHRPFTNARSLFLWEAACMRRLAIYNYEGHRVCEEQVRCCRSNGWYLDPEEERGRQTESD